MTHENFFSRWAEHAGIHEPDAVVDGDNSTDVSDVAGAVGGCCPNVEVGFGVGTVSSGAPEMVVVHGVFDSPPFARRIANCCRSCGLRVWPGLNESPGCVRLFDKGCLRVAWRRAKDVVIEGDPKECRHPRCIGVAGDHFDGAFGSEDAPCGIEVAPLIIAIRLVPGAGDVGVINAVRTVGIVDERDAGVGVEIEVGNVAEVDDLGIGDDPSSSA